MPVEDTLLDDQGALADMLFAQTKAGTVTWTTVSTFPLTFVARVRSNIFVLWRDADDYPDLLAVNSSAEVAIKSIRNLPLWSQVADSKPPFGMEPAQRVAVVRGMTLMVSKEGTS